MATKPSTTRKRATGGTGSLDRLSGSIDAAQDALKDLRGELSKGGRDALKDLDVLLRDVRKNLRSTQRTVLKDLEEMQKAVAGKRARAGATTRAPAKRTTTAKTASTGSARKTTGQRPRAARKA
jgi:hypothetical protein